MHLRRGGWRWIGRGALGLLTIGMWWLATVPTGYRVPELLMFAGPGMVLAIAGSWAAHLFDPGGWDWADGFSAAVVGAIVLPPIVAFSIALLSALSGSAVLVTLVLGAWIALGGGVAVAAARSLISEVRRARSGPPQLVLHRAQRGGRSPLARWPESAPTTHTDVDGPTDRRA